MCRVLGVSTSGYYAWLRHGAWARSRRDADLSARVAAIHDDSRRAYGVPGVHAEPAEDGQRVARKRVAWLMRALDLRGVSRRKWARTTLRDGAAEAVPDLVERDFTASRPKRAVGRRRDLHSDLGGVPVPGRGRRVDSDWKATI